MEYGWQFPQGDNHVHMCSSDKTWLLCSPRRRLSLGLICLLFLLAHGCGNQNDDNKSKFNRPSGARQPNVYGQKVKYLIGELKSETRRRRVGAVVGLGKMKSRATAAVPGLIDLFNNDKDPGVRAWAASSLSDIAPNDRRVIDALTKALKSEDELVRRVTTSVFWKGTQEKPSAALHLVHAIANDSSSKVRTEAAIALGELDVNSEKVRSSLRQARNDEDAAVSLAAKISLARLSDERKGLAVEATAVLKDKRTPPMVRAAATRGLWKLSSAKEVSDVLIPVLQEENPDMGFLSSVLYVLANLAPHHKPALRALLEVVKDRVSPIRCTAIANLPRADPEGKSTANALLQIIENPQEADDNAMRFAFFALKEIHISDKRLASALAAKWSHAPTAALATIGAMVQVGYDAVPVMILLINDKNLEAKVRGIPMGVLQHLGPITGDVIPTLTKAAGDKDAEVQATAKGVLKYFRREYPEASPPEDGVRL